MMREKVIFDDVLKKIPNKYILTIVMGKRVRELTRGAEPLVKVKPKTTLVQIAMLEVLEGKIVSDFQE